MKKLIRFSVAAFAALSVLAFSACSQNDDEDDAAGASSSVVESSISKLVGIRLGTSVSGKAIYRYYTILEGNKIKYEQTKFGNLFAGVTWDYEEVQNEDGSYTLKVSNGVADVEGTNFGSEDIIYDFSTGDESPTITATYYEGTTPKEAVSLTSRVYSGIEKAIGNTFLYAVSGKSISRSYAFEADGTAEYKLIKYEKLSDYGNYKYEITAQHLLTSDTVASSVDAETAILAYDKSSLAHDLNTYAVHFVYAATEEYTLEANDYSQGYGTATVTTTKSVVEGEEPDAPYIFITLVEDGVAKINITAATSTTTTDDTTGETTVTWAMSDSTDDVSEFTLYTE